MKAWDKLAKEAEGLRLDTLAQLGEEPPRKIKHLFSDSSRFFKKEVIVNWRETKRFDDLIKYILYNYEDNGGEELWKQILIDLKLSKDEERAHSMLNGLAKGRISLLKIAVENFAKYPNNYLCELDVAVRRAEVLKLLNERAWIAENKQSEEKNMELVNEIRESIREILDL